MSSWLPPLFGLIGVMVGGVITGLWQWVADRRATRREVYQLAYLCLDKWRQVLAADSTEGAAERYRKEKSLLGELLPKYIGAVPATSGRSERRRHFWVHSSMSETFVSLGSDESGLSTLSASTQDWQRELDEGLLGRRWWSPTP